MGLVFSQIQPDLFEHRQRCGALDRTDHVITTWGLENELTVAKVKSEGELEPPFAAVDSKLTLGKAK